MIYFRETDTLNIALREALIAESDEVRPGVIAGSGEDRGVVRFEVLRASRVVKDAERVQFDVTCRPLTYRRFDPVFTSMRAPAPAGK